jgi:hypothetical protein
MESYSSPDSEGRYFGFTDLHGFKDFVVEVIAGAPDDFMEMDWLNRDEQLNLDRAFEGLRYGLDLSETEKGTSETIAQCRQLVEESYAEYRAGRDAEGQRRLEEVDRLLYQIPSR